MDSSPSVDLDIVLPVYKEASTIEATLRGIASAIKDFAGYRFVIAADRDDEGTVDVIQALSRELPILIDASTARRGYSGAMRSALGRVRAPYVLCIDSDGQYDPADIAKLWQRRGDADIVTGWRVQRADALGRRIGSAAFGVVFRLFIRVRLHDPSCSIVLLKREVAELLLPRLGVMPEAFWWEFNGVAYRFGLSCVEVPVRHRPRAGGATQLYSLGRLPGVVWRQAAGLARLARRRG